MANMFGSATHSLYSSVLGFPWKLSQAHVLEIAPLWLACAILMVAPASIRRYLCCVSEACGQPNWGNCRLDRVFPRDPRLSVVCAPPIRGKLQDLHSWPSLAPQTESPSYRRSRLSLKTLFPPSLTFPFFLISASTSLLNIFYPVHSTRMLSGAGIP